MQEGPLALYFEESFLADYRPTISPKFTLGGSQI